VGGVSEGVDCVGEPVMMTEDDDWSGVVVGLGCIEVVDSVTLLGTVWWFEISRIVGS
jgi:hypothetical protein